MELIFEFIIYIPLNSLFIFLQRFLGHFYSLFTFYGTTFVLEKTKQEIMKNYTLTLIGLMTLIFTGNSYLNAQDCSTVNIVVTSGTQDDEIGWNIAQSNGWAILSGSVGTTNGCIQDGCWTFNMYDGTGDGWGGSMITISSEDEILFNGTLNNGNYEVNYIQIGDSEPCEETIYGCEYESELYSFGSTIEQDCNSCYCQAGFNPEANGIWACTEMDCGGCTDEYGYHENGSTWSPSPCQIFDCFNGYISEIIIDCPQWEGVPCEGTWVLEDGECCAECIETSDCENISITLSSGWNMIGFACANNTNATVAFEPIQNNIIIAKDAIGNAYLPDWGFNGIGNLERGYGYLIKVNESIENYNICD